MNTKTLGSRDFFRSPALVTRLMRAGTRIIVSRGGEELFEAVPRQPAKRKTIADFEHLIFSDRGMGSDVSKKVDQIVYGNL